MAKYTMRQVPQGLGKHPSQHPRLISEGRLSTEDLSERMAEGCTFSRAEIEGVLQLLGEELAKRLADGYIVHIDGVGSFRPKLGYRKDVALPEGEETAIRNATSLELADVRFHADRRLVQRTRRACRLQRAPHRSYTRPREGRERRLSQLLSYLRTHHILTRSEYVKLTGLSPTAATAELKSFVTAGHIVRKGIASHSTYRLPYSSENE
ncbi:HU family DNA-binding protein [Porphyromonas sp.]